MGPRIVIVMVVALSGCGALESNVPPPDTSPATTIPQTTTTTQLLANAEGCGGAPEDFRSDGPLGILGSSDGDGQQIAVISLTSNGECERLDIAVSTEGGAPATSLPTAEVELISAAGVVRIKFDPSVTSTAITDTLLEGSLIKAAFVVRSLDGSIFVDAHLSESVAARTFTQTNPTRVSVELQPIPGEAPEFPMVGTTVVVTGPSSRSVEYPIIVTGYARTFEANVIGRVSSATDAGSEAVTTAADYLQMWGEFRLEISAGPGGDITIFVGEGSPIDGEPIGVEFMVSSG